jgi:PAS domain S-box-containing protein
MFFSRFKLRLQGKNPQSNYLFRGIRKDKKTIWLEISSSRVEYLGKAAVQASFIDVTGRHTADR